MKSVDIEEFRKMGIEVGQTAPKTARNSASVVVPIKKKRKSSLENSEEFREFFGDDSEIVDNDITPEKRLGITVTTVATGIPVEHGVHEYHHRVRNESEAKANAVDVSKL